MEEPEVYQRGKSQLRRADAETEKTWRELIRPIVLEMHRAGLTRLEINKDGGNVELKIE